MADDPGDRLPPSGEIDPPAPGRNRKPLVCEFCECKLTSAGEVLMFSDKAKRHRTHDDAIEAKDRQIATLETELRDARAKLAEHASSVGAGSAGLTF